MTSSRTVPPKALQIVGNARYGGATLIMLEWVKYLRAKGSAVDVLCTDERMCAEVRAIDGVGLIDDIFIPKEIDVRQDLSALRGLVRLCRSERYDVVHTYTATPSFLGRFAASFARVPVVVNHQGGWAVNETSSRRERLLYTPLEYLGTLASTRNICVSNAERQKARDLHLAPDRKLVTIVNGIDFAGMVARSDNDARRAWREKLGCTEATLLIGTTGRLVPGKGNDAAIRAMAHLRQLAPHFDVRLVLAGDGDDRANLERLIIQERVEDRIDLLGFVDDVPGLLAALDVFVTPTHTEGLSMSLLEAMATGTAVVATDIPANAEVIDDGHSGLLVSVDAPHEIAKAILRLGEDEHERAALGEAGQRTVIEHHSMSRMMDETWALYEALLGSASSSMVVAR